MSGNVLFCDACSYVSLFVFFTEQSLPYKVSQKDEEDEDAITELCEDLYMSSAKCNMNLDDVQSAAYGVSIECVILLFYL